jgi:hypothetical protein
VLSGVGKIVHAGLAIERRTKPGRRGRQSDLRGTPELTRIFDAHGMKPIYGPSETIVLRSRKDGSLLPLGPMRDRRRQVDRINEMLEATSLSIEMTGAIRLHNHLWLFERLDEDDFGNPLLIQQKLRLDRMEGRRVFTSDLQHHGRFYCPAQNIPGSARLSSTLNGDPVVELDFTALHPSIAYALCGATMAGDPYDLPGFTRKQAKLGLLTSFNAISFQAAVASLTDARDGRPVFTSRKDAARLIEALKVRHAPIASMLCSDAGLRQMNIDSRIMLAAVDHLIDRGISSIPIHDSILVQAQYEGEARDALNFGWRNQNLSPTPCNIEKKRQKVLQYGGRGSRRPRSGRAGALGRLVGGDARGGSRRRCRMVRLMV